MRDLFALENLNIIRAQADETICDITDQTAVEELVATIRREFPPIGGIMNGAMVLQDVPFSEMSFEIMEKVLETQGTGNGAPEPAISR